MDDKFKDLLREGYVMVSSNGLNAALGDKLSSEGYKVAFVDLNLLDK